MVNELEYVRLIKEISIELLSGYITNDNSWGSWLGKNTGIYNKEVSTAKVNLVSALRETFKNPNHDDETYKSDPKQYFINQVEQLKEDNKQASKKASEGSVKAYADIIIAMINKIYALLEDNNLLQYTTEDFENNTALAIQKTLIMYLMQKELLTQLSNSFYGSYIKNLASDHEVLDKKIVLTQKLIAKIKYTESDTCSELTKLKAYRDSLTSTSEKLKNLSNNYLETLSSLLKIKILYIEVNAIVTYFSTGELNKTLAQQTKMLSEKIKAEENKILANANTSVAPLSFLAHKQAQTSSEQNEECRLNEITQNLGQGL